MFPHDLAAPQTPLEQTLTEEEARRNSRRLELLYVSSSNPITPDIFQLADQHKGADEQARAALSAPMNAQLTGASLGLDCPQPQPDTNLLTSQCCTT